jgi:hypothetical protein
MKTQINYIDGNWKRVKNACRTTVNKLHTENEPTSEFKTKILISEHSPIRIIKVNWIWNGIKSWVATHWSRHKWECFISSQRTDRTGIDRDKLTQDELVIFEGEANAQNLIDSERKRLCYQTSKETRESAEDLKLTLKKIEPELADVLVPNCIYRCGCPEFEQCGYWKLFYNNHSFNLVDIKSRYDAYNEYFYEKYKEKQIDSN